jgi:hypothetical protein
VLASRSAVVMAIRPTARDMERVAAARPPQLRRPPAPPGDALGMLACRGLRPSLGRPDLPFPSDISAETADLYVVNGRPDLMTNIGRAIAEGLLASIYSSSREGDQHVR